MTVTERARHARKRRGQVIATAVIVAAATPTVACDGQPTDVPAAASSPSRGDIPPRERLLPRAHVGQRRPAPTPPARIGTALTIKRLRVTAYCYGTTTYTGVRVRRGMAAVKASTGIAFGARLHVADAKRLPAEVPVLFVVTDREPERGSSHVDLYLGYLPGCEAIAKRFGVQRLPVEIEEAA